MPTRYILSDYVQQALSRAVYETLDDGTFAGRIPDCNGSGRFRVKPACV